MSRLADPTICPDCRARLDQAATCTGCGLQVTGPLAAELWTRMVDADRIVEQLRTLSGRVATPMPASRPAATDALPAFPRSTTAPPRSRLLPAASVPVVLLFLGGLCLLVAAVVFVAVAWSALDITGRTLVLAGVTSLLAVAAVGLTRKGLRGAAETVWLVVAGMLMVDLLGARSAGLAGLDTLDWRATGALLGTVLLVTGLAIGLWAQHQPVRRLYGAELVVVAGATIVTATNGWFAANTAVACTIAVPVLVALFVGLRSLLPTAAYGVGGLALTTWVALLLTGWDRALEPTGLGAWWADLRGWPLVVAAVFAAVLVHAPGVPGRVRPVAAGLALFPLVLLAEAPQTPGTGTHDLAVAAGVLLALGVITYAGNRAWALGAGSLAAVGVLGLGCLLTLAPWDVLTGLGTAGAGPVDLKLPGSGYDVAAWTYGVVGLSVAGTLVLMLRLVPASRRIVATSCVSAVAPAVLALGGLTVVLHLEPRLWAAVLAAAVATAVAGAAAWWMREERVAGWTGAGTTAYLTVLTLRTATADDLVLAIALSALLLPLLAAYVERELSGGPVSAGVIGALAALTGAGTLFAWASWFGSDADGIAVALALYAAFVGIGARPVTRRGTSRISLEGSALVIGLTAATYPADPSTTAMALTIVGGAICLVSVTDRDRQVVSWLGAAVLGLATLMRVVMEVQAPELYTLPAALLLVVAGLWRLRTDADVNSFAALGSGLTLGLLPSLLLALEEPVSLRGALIAAAGVLVLAVGVRERMAAPFVLGAVTTGLLAVRHLEPYADAVPRWISLGAVGLGLLLVGITWEARRHNLETAGRYLADLR